MNTKNNAVEAFRFLLTCMICLWHCWALVPWLHHGYIAVEFFFITSGFFIYQSWLRHPERGVLDFTWNKAKRFFPPLFIAFILLMAIDRKQYFYPPEVFTADTLLTKYFSHIQELFFSQAVGIDRGILAVNGPTWYISVLLVGGAIVYAFLRQYKQTAVSVFLPLICIIGMTYILSNNSTIEGRPHTSFISSSLLRGIAEMSLGALVAVLLQRKRESFSRHRLLLDGMALFSILGFVLLSLSNGGFDHLVIFFVPIILIDCFTEGSVLRSLFRHKVWGWLGGISLYMYIIHLLVSHIYYIIAARYDFSFVPLLVQLVLYLIVVLVSAVALRKASDALLRFFENPRLINMGGGK